MKAKKEILKEILEKAHAFGYELFQVGSDVAMIFAEDPKEDPCCARIFLEKRNKCLVLTEWSTSNPRKYLGWVRPAEILNYDLPSDMEYHIIWRTDYLEEPR